MPRPSSRLRSAADFFRPVPRFRSLNPKKSAHFRTRESEIIDSNITMREAQSGPSSAASPPRRSPAPTRSAAGESPAPQVLAGVFPVQR